MRYVIIGNSAAGIGAVEGIRQVDKEGEIVIISNEVYHTYSKPLISYLLLKKTDEQKMKYRGDTFYKDNNCKTMFGSRVTRINPYEKNVELEDTSKIIYDKLLLATGSSPFIPPIDGLCNVEDKFTFTSLEDAKALEKTVTSNSKVLIIGAGLIGLKCAEALQGKAGSVTIVFRSNNILSSILDSDGAAIVKKHFFDKGVNFKSAQVVKHFSKNRATLENGEEVPFDVLILAVGGRPNTQLLSEAGGRVNHGIVTDNSMRTSLPDVFAAGDCTESYDISSQQNRVLALLPNAYMQGECAGINMAGGQCVFDKAIPMNAISFFGLHIATAGSYEGESYVEKCNGYKKLFYKDDVLKGFILIGNIEKAGIYTSIVREQTPLSSIDFNLICKNPVLMAFSKEERNKKLGSAPV